ICLVELVNPMEHAVSHNTDDLRIREVTELSPPSHVTRQCPCTSDISSAAVGPRRDVQPVLTGTDDRIVAVIGPCSIHNPAAALDYAKRLREQRDRYAGELEIIMRVYFEKPRTTVGWKGLINDPALDGSFNINKGLRTARELLI